MVVPRLSRLKTRSSDKEDESKPTPTITRYTTGFPVLGLSFTPL